jgi:hypothetical protein
MAAGWEFDTKGNPTHNGWGCCNSEFRIPLKGQMCGRLGYKKAPTLVR